MKKIKFRILIYAFLFVATVKSIAQDSLQKIISLNLNFFAIDNTEMYLIAEAKTKIDGRFRSVPNLWVKFFLDDITTEMFIDSAITDHQGKAKAYIPPRLKSTWLESNKHTLLATSDENNIYKSGEIDLSITKSKLSIDTLIIEDVKYIKVLALSLEPEGLVPIKDLEIKIGVKRIGGLLKVTEEETYNTDSSGSIKVAFIDTSLAGDNQGKILIEAMVEDNELYGNLKVHQPVYWGKPYVSDQTNFFDLRTLWSTQFKTPYWLLFIIYSMTIGIWGTIIVVIWSLIKIIKLGNPHPSNKSS